MLWTCAIDLMIFTINCQIFNWFWFLTAFIVSMVGFAEMNKCKDTFTFDGSANDASEAKAKKCDPLYIKV